MGRGRAIIIALIGAGLTALFVWIMTIDPSQRLFGIGGVLFFGACTLIAISALFPTKIPPVDVDGSTTIPNSPFRCASSALALIAVAAAAVLFITTQEASSDWRRFVFWIMPIPCVVLAFKYLQWAFAGAPAFRLDAEGLTRFHWGERTVRWADVVAVRTMTVRGAKSILLDLSPEARRARPWPHRLTAHLGGGDLTLSTATSGVDPEALEDLVRRYWRSGAKLGG